MNQIRLFIARHGETDYNKWGLLQGRGIDQPLNKTGETQAQLLADYLVNYKAEKLISSSLTRAWQTASFYGNRTDLRIHKNSGLDEMDFGDYEGISMREIASELDELQNSWMKGDVSLRVPGGESPRETFERADTAARTYLDSSNSDIQVMIIHGRLIRILLSVWLGYGLKNMHKIEHENGAVNQITYKNGVFCPVYLNKTDHLEMLKNGSTK